MRRILTTIFCAALVLWAFVTLAMHTARAPQLHGGAASVDDLVNDLLAAVAARDEAALQRLRVSEDEYRTVIIPGTVEPGQPPRQVSDLVSHNFWRFLDTKSRDFTHILLNQFGGQRLERRTLTYKGGGKQYQGYTALGELRLAVIDPEGQEQELRSGTIAEVGGSYKFIGLNWDD